MAEHATPHNFMSVEDYLEFERDAAVRHEYVDGQLHAMTGTSKRHNLIALNIVRTLSEASRDTPCQVYMSDVKVQVPGCAFYYPDVVVACESEPDDPYIEQHPCLIVEVISPSTADKDHREKLEAYKTIPTLRAYLIVYQDRRRVDRYHRDHDGAWQRAPLIGDGSVPVPCPETDLALAAIYEGL